MQISYQKYDEKKFYEDIGLFEEYRGYSLKSEEKLRFDKNKEIALEKPQQVARALPEETIGLDCVQSYISNMSTATTFEELLLNEGITLPENLLGETEIEWTAPRWAKAGDVVFFMHSKTSKTKITALRSELKKKREEISPSDYELLNKYIEHALEIYSKYGGKIFAVGRVCGGSEFVEAEEVLSGVQHWRSRYYSMIDNIQKLKNPIDLAEFRGYITLSCGGATTPLIDKEFEHLKEDIGKKNDLPDYILHSIARPIPLREINSKNWIEVANDYRRCFILEKQFRRYYVDYLLRGISDQRQFVTECRCQRNDIHDSYMDYVIRLNGKYLPVETKLSVAAEQNIVGQVSKYVRNSYVFLKENKRISVSKENFHDEKVLIIDTDKVYMYDDRLGKVKEIYRLDDLTSREMLTELKHVIMRNL